MRLVAVLRFTPRLAAGIIVAALFAGLGAVTMRALPVLRLIALTVGTRV